MRKRRKMAKPTADARCGKERSKDVVEGLAVNPETRRLGMDPCLFFFVPWIRQLRRGWGKKRHNQSHPINPSNNQGKRKRRKRVSVSALYHELRIFPSQPFLLSSISIFLHDVVVPSKQSNQATHPTTAFFTLPAAPDRLSPTVWSPFFSTQYPFFHFYYLHSPTQIPSSPSSSLPSYITTSHIYLKSTFANNPIFIDFSNLSLYLKSPLPRLDLCTSQINWHTKYKSSTSNKFGFIFYIHPRETEILMKYPAPAQPAGPFQSMHTYMCV
ncbi:hypothetical protein QBC38DRAFT_214324 [Podospora fimiseda]|uniref:Uncharacterized protein n=1 Tax=Podospora fimiseda TaxID=252190 RepID=A0AAN7BP12_9PEZI|nr:hypothetical protein QBC38DRAFT_214324 [Podospora fimiseda]